MFNVQRSMFKVGAVLKELKECRTTLKIIRRKEMIKPVARTDGVFKETEELIAVIGKSVGAATKNKKTRFVQMNSEH